MKISPVMRMTCHPVAFFRARSDHLSRSFPTVPHRCRDVQAGRHDY
jgi:hypothetical protein